MTLEEEAEQALEALAGNLHMCMWSGKLRSSRYVLHIVGRVFEPNDVYQNGLCMMLCGLSIEPTKRNKPRRLKPTCPYCLLIAKDKRLV